VNLDAATGKLRWYYQGVTNDFMDHDMQTSPIAAIINGQPAVVGSGKMGVVYAMNAGTGKLIWKTPVGEHSKSDDYPLEAMEHTLTLTAPYTILPGSLGGVLSNLALAGDTVYVATVDQPFTLAKMSYPLGAQDGHGAGEIVALNLTHHRQGRVGHQGAGLPAGCRHSLRRPRLHYPVHGRPDRARPRHWRHRLPAQAAHFRQRAHRHRRELCSRPCGRA
jgi:hypothetical protein